ncbi:hypothetical protein RIF29_14567 [Crotalaria pallida]|uniref:CASP-like protein n=1 Tax=Crotalaria pallida TaxID=3830 RepID=A0AAN9FDM4_CROPI
MFLRGVLYASILRGKQIGRSLTQDMEKAKSEEKADRMKRDSEGKEESEQEDNKDNQHPVTVSVSLSEPSSSITFHSPSISPIPSLRTHESPSPPLHSLSDSPIPHGGYSPESSISDDHFSINDPPVVVAHRFQVEPKVVTKVDPVAEEGFVGIKDAEQASGNRRLRPDVTVMLRSRKVAMLSKVLFGLRITAFVFCLLSLSVLAADKQQGWALDSFYFYKEFRYSLSVNVIGFVYSGFQICDLVKYLITGKHLVDHRLRGYFSFALDQVLTYLLMSASSSAATRAYDWESNWGEDRFPYMANASVALSFIAFVAFALASLVSGSIVCDEYESESTEDDSESEDSDYNIDEAELMESSEDGEDNAEEFDQHMGHTVYPQFDENSAFDNICRRG